MLCVFGSVLRKALNNENRSFFLKNGVRLGGVFVLDFHITRLFANERKREHGEDFFYIAFFVPPVTARLRQHHSTTKTPDARSSLGETAKEIAVVNRAKRLCKKI
jgi:hypothetical protein